jgi:hypothetical protein
MLNDLGADPASAENIIDWQVQRIATYSGPLARFKRDLDSGATFYDAVPVGQGYNVANVGLEPDWAAIQAWAGGPFRLEYAYNQSEAGVRHLGPANRDKRVPTYAELPLMVQRNGKWYLQFTPATRMMLDSNMGVKGQVISFTMDYTSGQSFIEWGYTNTIISHVPVVAHTWSPNTNVVAPTNTVPNERGDVTYAMRDDGMHVYTTRWRAAPSSSSPRADGWQTWRDDELICSTFSTAVQLNVDYSHDDATVGWTRFGGGSLNAIVGPIYIFRDTTSSLDVLPDDAAVAALITQQVTDHDTAPNAWDNWNAGSLDFTTATYLVNGSSVSLASVLGGTHSISGAGLLVNNSTAAKTPAGALLTAIQSKEFVLQIEVGTVTGVATSTLNLLQLTTSTGAVNWQFINLALQTMTGMPRTGSDDLVNGVHTLQISANNDLQIHCQAPTSPQESAYVTTGTISAATMFGTTGASLGDIRIKRIRWSTTPFKSSWDFIDKMREDYLPVGPTNPNDLRLGLNLGTFYLFSAGDPDWLVDYYISRGVRTYRLPIDWDGSKNSDGSAKTLGIQPTPNGALDTNYITNINRVVNKILAAGGEAILDCHEFGGNINGGRVADRSLANFVDFWTKMTNTFPKSPRVGYCIMNEPNSVYTNKTHGSPITALSYVLTGTTTATATCTIADTSWITGRNVRIAGVLGVNDVNGNPIAGSFASQGSKWDYTGLVTVINATQFTYPITGLTPVSPATIPPTVTLKTPAALSQQANVSEPITKAEYTTVIEQPIITAIRNAGGLGPIHVSIQGTYTAASSAASYADDKLALTDPLNNLVLEVHEYYNNDGGGNDATTAKYKATAQAIRVMKWAKANNWTLFWGEFGAGNTRSGGATAFGHSQEVYSFYKLLNAHRDVVRGCASWTGGRIQSDPAYIYAHDPRYVTGTVLDAQPGEHYNVGLLKRWSSVADLSTQPPYCKVAPTISGSLIEGQILTCNPGEWDRSEGYLYLWYRDGVSIAVTTQTYLLVAGDVGKHMSCRVTATNATYGNTNAVSVATNGIQPAAAPSVPAFDVAPSITAAGALVVGTVLTLNDGQISGYPTPTLVRKWYRSGALIAGATTSYTLATVDNGKLIKATVDATNSQGTVQGVSNILSVPDPALGTATLTLGTEYNLSALSGDLGMVYEITSATSPINGNRKCVVGRHAAVGASANTVLASTGVWVTTDGGATWSVQLLPNESEPTVWSDVLGNFYVTTSGASDFRCRSISASGTTLGGVTIVGGYIDRTQVHVDISGTSAFPGRIYAGGRTGSAGGLRIYRSDDGINWSASTTTLNADFNKGFMYGLTTAPDGTVYVTWCGPTNILTSNGVHSGSNKNYYVCKSTDGGVTFSVTFVFKDQETVSTEAGVGYRTWPSNVVVNPVTGRLHVIISQGKASDRQQKQHFYSDDQGASWVDHGFIDLGLPSGWGPGHSHLSVNVSGHLLFQFYAVNSGYNSNRRYAIGSKTDGLTWNGTIKVNTTDSPSVSPEPRAVIGEDRTYGNANPDGSFNVVWQSHLTANNIYAARIRTVTIS